MCDGIRPVKIQTSQSLTSSLLRLADDQNGVMMIQEKKLLFKTKIYGVLVWFNGTDYIYCFPILMVLVAWVGLVGLVDSNLTWSVIDMTLVQ